MNRGRHYLARRLLRKLVKEMALNPDNNRLLPEALGLAGGYDTCKDERTGNASGFHGFYHLGNGSFSTVLHHPKAPGVVFKVNFRNEDASHEWAQFCKDNCTHNEHLPRVDAVLSSDIAPNRGWYAPPLMVAVMERLDAASHREYDFAMEDSQWLQDELEDEGFPCWDLHSDNVMMRRGEYDDVWVLTDPSTGG